MGDLNLILPVVLVLIAFSLKLVVGKDVQFADALQTTIELPVDIIFLALSFVVAFTLSKVENHTTGLCHCFIGIVFAILVVFLSNRTQKMFLKNNKWFFLLLFVNLSVASYTVYYSIDLLVSIENKDKLPNNNKPN